MVAIWNRSSAHWKGCEHPTDQKLRKWYEKESLNKPSTCGAALFGVGVLKKLPNLKTHTHEQTETSRKKHETHSRKYGRDGRSLDSVCNKAASKRTS